MREYYRRNLPLYRRETIGFALFLGWVFCTLFGCGLATHDAAIDGTLTNYNLERIWMVSGLFEGLGGLGGIVAVFVNKEIDISLCRFSTLRWQAPTHLPS